VSCNASNHKYEKQLQNLVVIIRCMIWKTQWRTNSLLFRNLMEKLQI
jgi:hypothetical protein